MKVLRRLTIMVVTGLVLAGAPAHAQSIPDFLTARGIAVGATRSFATGVDAIFLNPAGLAMLPTYQIELDYGHDASPKADLNSGDGLVASVADGASNPHLATGFAYRYASLKINGVSTRGSIYDLAFATPIMNHVFLGIRGSYLSYTSDQPDMKHITGDAGMMILLGPVIVSCVGFNLISLDTADAPQGVSAGVAYTNHLTLNIGGDVRWQFFDHKKYVTYSAGGEYLIASMVPVRAGFLADGMTGGRFVTAGTGFYLSQFGFDATYRHDLRTGENAWIFAVKMFMGGGS